MIKVLNHYHNPKMEPRIVKIVQAYYNEARDLMPELPKDIKLYFYDKIIIPGYASGGFAYAPDTITIGFDDTYEDDSEKWHQLRGSIMHESYHLAQDFIGFDMNGEPRPLPPAIEQAIYEGAATVFEREYTVAKKGIGYAEYLDSVTMKQWVKEVQALTGDYDVNKWMFYDPDTDRKWVLYRTGVFIIDQAIQNSGLSILDFRHKSADEILKIANLT